MQLFQMFFQLFLVCKSFTQFVLIYVIFKTFGFSILKAPSVDPVGTKFVKPYNSKRNIFVTCRYIFLQSVLQNIIERQTFYLFISFTIEQSKKKKSIYINAATHPIFFTLGNIWLEWLAR